MLVAIRKEIYSSKLVLKDVVSGSPEVSRAPPGPPIPVMLKLLFLRSFCLTSLIGYGNMILT